MEDRLPKITERTGSLPIAGVRPLRYELAVLPRELVLAPGLRGIAGGIVSAGLELHVYVVAVDQRDLVVYGQFSPIGCLLLRNQGIVDDVGQDVVQALAGDTDAAAMLWVLGPLRPTRADGDGGGLGGAADAACLNLQ